jgi:GxxExxY protein
MREFHVIGGGNSKQTSRSPVDVVGGSLVDSAIKVHRALGPGLLESVYQECLAHELRSRGLGVQCEVELPVRYNSMRIDIGYRVDMIIEDLVVVENKTVDRLLPVHSAQVLTYLRMSGCRLGFLLNWFVPLIKDGIRRIVV